MDETKTTWKRFEERTQTALEAIGYVVERDVLLNGNQIDLFARKEESLITHNLVVECKYYRKRITIDHLRKFHSTISSVTEKSKTINGLFISQMGFTKEAKTFAQSVNILTFSLDELLAHSFDVESILNKIVAKFEYEELFSNYIPLSCKVSEHGDGTIYKPVEKFLNKYLNETTRIGAAILGNFGTGKTSLAKHYSYLLAKEYYIPTSNCYKALPLYINLREVEHFKDIEQTLLNKLNNHYNAKATSKGFKYWLNYQNTLLIFDGFDEMASKMNIDEITNNINNLFEFTRSYPRIKLLITCRTHFFKNQLGENLFGDILKLYIRDWGETELSDYIKIVNPKNQKQVIKTIKTTYNLEDLAKTPLFLDMITKTIEKIGPKINKSKLYSVYTDTWIQNQEYRSQLNPDDKVKFMEELAFYLFQQGIVFLNYQALPSIITKYFHVKDYALSKKMDLEVRTCTFLVRTDQGDYHFVHKSFLEYFVSLKLAKEVKSNKFENFSSQNLTHEISSFFGDYFEDEVQFIIKNLIRHENANVRSNFALVAGYLPFSDTMLKALLLAIDTDENERVKLNGIDSLGNLNHEIAIHELVRISEGKDSVGLYALKVASRFTNHGFIVNLLLSIIKSSFHADKLSVAIDTLSQDLSDQTTESLVILSKKYWWHAEDLVIVSFLNSVINRKNLILSLNIDKIIESRSDDANILYQCESAQRELKNKFANSILEDAIANEKLMSLKKNRRMLYEKYGYLQDNDDLHHSISKLYSKSEIQK